MEIGESMKMKTEEEIINEYLAREKAKELEVKKIETFGSFIECSGCDCSANASLMFTHFLLASGARKYEHLCPDCLEKAKIEMKMQGRY